MKSASDLTIIHIKAHIPLAMYQYYQIMICLLKFDFFCFAGITIQARIDNIALIRDCSCYIQLLILVLKKNSAEFGVTVAAIPVVLILLILCGIAVQREIKW